ncbi:hypothetical protein MBBAR_19c00050 [Methanobrevibacter arboriphilus JCM 13429 = DSM 1125]|uniref:DUF1697 domain-containing protein n=2 Tax=Methanobrevibacter arboriphilus TaxID=39441 RepID=A0A1V6N1A7_METAZ|nr:DUF1697 domain-containing protein [Methanobrevibacter arboriphilus]OQD58343.1 hypothetical protein MBBAR_19c00050 [Methanobrevibacter arboriphilus JCM 13429 = DSM 1125]
MKYIAFLRGINVGKNNIIPMKDLRNLFSVMGFKNIKTYLRSGNVIFESNEKDMNNISSKISENIENSSGFWIDCILMSQKDFIFLINNNPFFSNNSNNNSNNNHKNNHKNNFNNNSNNNEMINELYVTIFKHKINRNLGEDLIKDSKKFNSDDKFLIFEKEIYLICKNGYHKTKFNNNYFESKLDNTATTRSFKTLLNIKNLLI